MIFLLHKDYRAQWNCSSEIELCEIYGLYIYEICLSVLVWLILCLIDLLFQDLANAGATKRPTCCVLVLTKPVKGELGSEEQDKLKADYNHVIDDVKELSSTLF